MAKAYTVTLRFEHPSHDERDGISYRGIVAIGKREACRAVRKQALRDGHLPSSGRGWISLTAVEDDA